MVDAARRRAAVLVFLGVATSSPQNGAEPGSTHPLVVAIRKGRVQRVRELLKEHGDVSAVGGYAMCAAVEAGEEFIGELLSHGVTVYAPTANGDTGLLCAAELCRVDAMRQILDAAPPSSTSGINIQNRRGSSALTKVIQSVRDHGVPVTAASEAVEFLLSRGAAVNMQSFAGYGRTPLIEAAISGLELVLTRLVDYAAAVDVQDGNSCSALEIACTLSGIAGRGGGMPERWMSIAKILHDKGARFDIDAGGFDKSCGMLAGNPIALDAIAAFKRSVLPALPRQVYEAAISNDLREVLGWLKEPDRPAGNAHVDARVSDDEGGGTYEKSEIAGRTLLMLASDRGHLELVRTLLQHDATVNLQSQGLSALMLAVRAGGPDPAAREAVVALLLDHGAALDLQNMQGETALMMATERGRPSIVRLLVSRGATRDIRDVAGRAAIDVSGGDPALLQALDTTARFRERIREVLVTIAGLILAAWLVWGACEPLNEKLLQALAGAGIPVRFFGEERREKNQKRATRRKKAKESQMCVVCLDERKTHAMLPCLHKCVCGTCAELMTGPNVTCPMCREPVESCKPVFE